MNYFDLTITNGYIQRSKISGITQQGIAKQFFYPRYQSPIDLLNAGNDAKFFLPQLSHL